jgi:phosphatidylglycerol lysyltransferase
MIDWIFRLSAQSAGLHLASRSTRAHALILGLQGLLNLIWAVIPDGILWPAQLGGYTPLFWNAPGRLFNLVFGAVLVVLAGGLRRRKIYAWWAALILYTLSAGLHLAAAASVGFAAGWLPALLSIGLAGWLLVARTDCIARSRPQAVKTGLMVWAGILALVMLSGAMGFGSIDDGAQGWLGALGIFFRLHDPGYASASGGPLWLTNLIYALAIFAWGYLLWMLELPLLLPPPATPAERRRARQIVEAYGHNSMAHLTLLDDKRYFFTPGGSLVAYSVSGRVAVTLGDPVGPTADAPEAIRSFVHYCVSSDWLPAFCLTSGEYLDVYRKIGFQTICMGHEGIIDLQRFTLKGNQAKTIRKRYNRLNSQGYNVEVYEPPIPEDVLRELRGISDQWLKMASAAEKRFFLAWFDEDYVRNERIGLVRGPDGGVCSFTNLVPEYQVNEISIDLMRRHPDISSGTMDYLFVSLFLWARDQGYGTFNLGLSPLFGVGENPGSSLLEKGIRYLYHHGNFYDFKGLNGFKMKFRPSWTPQYLVYPGLLNMGLVGLTMARVNAGENETLIDYFRSRPKQVRHEDPEELALLPETNGD